LKNQNDKADDDLARLNRRLVLLTAQLIAAARAIRSQSVLIETMDREGHLDLAGEATDLRDLILQKRSTLLLQQKDTINEIERHGGCAHDPISDEEM
jgi:hypothetical protein